MLRRLYFVIFLGLLFISLVHADRDVYFDILDDEVEHFLSQNRNSKCPTCPIDLHNVTVLNNTSLELFLDAFPDGAMVLFHLDGKISQNYTGLVVAACGYKADIMNTPHT